MFPQEVTLGILQIHTRVGLPSIAYIFIQNVNTYLNCNSDINSGIRKLLTSCLVNTRTPSSYSRIARDDAKT